MSPAVEVALDDPVALTSVVVPSVVVVVGDDVVVVSVVVAVVTSLEVDAVAVVSVVMLVIVVAAVESLPLSSMNSGFSSRHPAVNNSESIPRAKPSRDDMAASIADSNRSS
jgi:hypothetical protein